MTIVDISYVLYSSIIEDAWIGSTFYQVLRHNECAVIPDDIHKGLAENVLMKDNKSSHVYIQLYQSNQIKRDRQFFQDT